MGKGILPKNKLLLLLFLLNIAIILILSGCSKGNEPEQDKANFGLYLLEDQSITWEDLKTRNLDSLKLKEWITSDKIDFYDYSTHVIYLNVDYNTLFAVPHNDNTPFVVVANNKRCYYGRFSPPKDTTQPHVVIKPLELCNDLIMLEFNPPHRKDIRVNEEVKEALTETQKIKTGIMYYYDREALISHLNEANAQIHLYSFCYNYEEKNIFLPTVHGAVI